MDSRQSTSKTFDMMKVQNQDDNMASTSIQPEDCVTKTKAEEPNPLDKPNILEKVFSLLDVESIKNARQVKKLWSSEGAKMLMNKCFVKIPWDLKNQDLSINSNRMDQFKAFLSHKTSDTLMIPNITIGAAADLDIWNLLGVLGPEIKAVKLKCIDYEAKLLLKLFDALPNIEYLNFRELRSYHNKINTNVLEVMSRPEKIVSKLIISNMTFQAHDLRGLERIEKFFNCTNIMTEELKFDFIPNILFQVPVLEDRILNIMSKLLSTNQSILKRLALINCQYFLSLLEFPCLTKLTHIDLEFFPETDGQLSRCKFPPSFRFLDQFPNLQEIFTNFKTPNSSFYPTQGYLQLLLGTTGPAPSVKLVKSLHHLMAPDDSVEFLFKIFPNVEDLHMFVNSGVKSWFTSLWTLGKNLKRLHLHFNVGQVYETGDFDSIFTGFTPQTVDEIKDDPNLAPYSPEKIKQLRINSSILNLKELELITMDLDFYYWNLYCFLPERMLTVAEKYSFRLLPKKPKIIIHVKERHYGHVANVVMGALKEVSQLANVTVTKN